MFEEKDPAEDRDEFESRVKRILTPKFCIQQEECLKALVMQDFSIIKTYQDDYLDKKNKVEEYLRLWDSASTKEEKMAVVASVKR